MPIRADLRHHYGPAWRALSLRIRAGRAGWRCEWPGCGARHGEPHPITGSTVVLTVMHLDHDPANNDEANLRAACQRCHNRYDSRHRRTNAAFSRWWRCGQADLFVVPVSGTPAVFGLSSGADSEAA